MDFQTTVLPEKDLTLVRVNLTLEFTTYDGQLGSRPPIFDPVETKLLPLPHTLDGTHKELMVIPVDQYKPLSMAFMLFYLNVTQKFEWCSKYSAKVLCDECGKEISLDEAGYVSFPLKIGDRWAFWPTIPLN